MVVTAPFSVMPQAEMTLVPCITLAAFSTRAPGIGAPAEMKVFRLASCSRSSRAMSTRSARNGVEPRVRLHPSSATTFAANGGSQTSWRMAVAPR
ncbi:hypothetical protein D3C78_1457990 [compost metagenome]